MYRKNAFTLVEILIVIAILGLLSGIAIPNLIKAREGAEENACKGNMAMIEAAIEQWALDSNIASGTGVAANQSSWDDYLRDGTLPSCPGGGTYSYTGGEKSGNLYDDYEVQCSIHGVAE